MSEHQPPSWSSYFTGGWDFLKLGGVGWGAPAALPAGASHPPACLPASTHQHNQLCNPPTPLPPYLFPLPTPDLHIVTLLAPAGLLACFNPLTDASLFLLLYGVTGAPLPLLLLPLPLVLMGGAPVRRCCHRCHCCCRWCRWC